MRALPELGRFPTAMGRIRAHELMWAETRGQFGNPEKGDRLPLVAVADTRYREH
jgi:hypothetical protein